MITLSVDDSKDVITLMKMMLTRIDPGGKHMIASNMKEAFELMSEDVDIVFLDIEMPGINGLEAADLLQSKYPRLNIIFVTGHPEYAYSAHGVHPSGFLSKPIDEYDIMRELKHLRFPLGSGKSGLCVQCSPFAVYFDNEQINFKSAKTTELFAYLIYRDGAFCTIDEVLTALWGGDVEKSGRLRQLVMDLRSSLAEVNSESVVSKKYGKLGLNMQFISVEGNKNAIVEQFGWIL